MREESNSSTCLSDLSAISALERRISYLERRYRRFRQLVAGIVVVTLTVCALGFARDRQDAVDIIRAKSIVIVDDEGRPRIRLGSGGERLPGSSFGIALLDEHGAERFGVSTWDNGRVGMGFDAPRGVGNPMPDRMAFEVGADGRPGFVMLNNDTTVPIRIHIDENDRAVIEFVDWDRSGEEPRVRGFMQYGIEQAFRHNDRE